MLISVKIVATTSELFFPFYPFLFFFPIFIFHSLSYSDAIIICVQAKRSSVKLDTYRKFSNSLAVAVIASVVWIGYEVCSPVKTLVVLIGNNIVLL